MLTVSSKNKEIPPNGDLVFLLAWCSRLKGFYSCFSTELFLARNLTKIKSVCLCSGCTGLSGWRTGWATFPLMHGWKVSWLTCSILMIEMPIYIYIHTYISLLWYKFETKKTINTSFFFIKVAGKRERLAPLYTVPSDFGLFDLCIFRHIIFIITFISMARLKPCWVSTSCVQVISEQ